jgi:2-polyprenyl-3-methyl-5-hydroxy-6-metoxy-1,4-benzoquinol methylase
MISLVSLAAKIKGQTISPLGTNVLSRLFFYERDIRNMLKYGETAPLSASVIYINPNSVKKAIAHYESPRLDTGMVKAGDWDLKARDIATIKKIKGVKQRIVHGKPWEKTACWTQNLAYVKRGKGADGIRTVADIRARYRKLDKFIASAAKHREAAYKSRLEISPRSFREAGGIMVNIDRNGELLFGMRGCHRMAIAQALELECIPVQLGMVHEEAVKRGIWKKNIIDEGKAAHLRLWSKRKQRVAKKKGARALLKTSAPVAKAKPAAPAVVDTSKPYYPIRYGEHTTSSSIAYGRNREENWNAVPLAKFERLIPLIPGKSVVEIGAAEGILSLTLAPHKERVRAIEIAPIRHERGVQLKERWRELGKPVDNVEMILADIFARPEVLDGYDTLLASRVIYYFGDRLNEFMANASKSVRYVCFIGNETRARLYRKGAYKELGEEYAKYTTAPGMCELVERHGFRVINTIVDGDPVVIAERVENAALGGNGAPERVREPQGSN